MNIKCLVLSILGAVGVLAVIVGGGMGLVWAFHFFPDWVGLTIAVGGFLGIVATSLYRVCNSHVATTFSNARKANHV